MLLLNDFYGNCIFRTANLIAQKNVLLMVDKYQETSIFYNRRLLRNRYFVKIAKVRKKYAKDISQKFNQEYKIQKYNKIK